MDAPAPRTPLHAMSDEQLLFYADDELAPQRDVARQLLEQRADEAWLEWSQNSHSRKVPPLVERIRAFGRKA